MIDKQWSIEKDGFLFYINKAVTNFKKTRNLLPSYIVLGQRQMKGLESHIPPVLVQIEEKTVSGYLDSGWKKVKFKKIWDLHVVPIGLEDYFGLV